MNTTSNTSPCDVCGGDSRPMGVMGGIGRAYICDACRPAVIAEIDARRERGEPVSAIDITQGLRPPEDPGDNSPTIAQIRAFCAEHGITGGEAARRAYLSGGQAFRKYTGGARPHRMSGAVWFTLVARTILPAETVSEIERIMSGRD